MDYKGMEFTAFGRVTSNVVVTASGLVMDAEQTKAANALVLGKRPENTAKWTASLFAEWSPPQLQGFAVSAGVFSIGNRAVNAANQGFIPGYTTFDAGARYRWETGGHQFSAQLNLENLLDKGFWSTAGNGLVGVGPPRTAKFQISATY